MQRAGCFYVFHIGGLEMVSAFFDFRQIIEPWSILQMPTVLRIDGFRFFFYSKEGTEPPHIHVEQGDEVAKFWLDPVELSSSYGFSAKEINHIRKLVVEHQTQLLQTWHDYFD